jgi:TonB family protein
VKRHFLWSLVGHLILFLLLVIYDLTHSPSEVPLPPQALEVKTLSEADFQKAVAKALNAKERQIVQTDTRLKSSDSPSEKEEHFLSGQNQRVDRNTRAAKVGKFKNVLNQGNPNGGDNKQGIAKLFELGPSEEAKEDSAAQAGGREPASVGTGRLRKPASVESGPRGEGESATDDYLEDVAIGAQTLLNAKEYKFYGFYARIREKLSESWHLKLKEELPLLEAQGTPIINTTRRTSVRVFLSPSGQLQKIQLLQSSGLGGLDRAATDAFRMAAPFPNPPREMISEDDGLVAIKWEFVIVADANSNVQFTVERR